MSVLQSNNPDIAIADAYQAQCDHAAEVEREVAELARMPLDELMAELTDAERNALDEHTRERIMDYYADAIAERRIQHR